MWTPAPVEPAIYIMMRCAPLALKPSSALILCNYGRAVQQLYELCTTPYRPKIGYRNEVLLIRYIQWLRTRTRGLRWNGGVITSDRVDFSVIRVFSWSDLKRSSAIARRWFAIHRSLRWLTYVSTSLEYSRRRAFFKLAADAVRNNYCRVSYVKAGRRLRCDASELLTLKSNVCQQKLLVIGQVCGRFKLVVVVVCHVLRL